MNLFYLIQAHKHPIQLKRLIERLNDKDVQFIIHIDLKSDIKEFNTLINHENVYFTQNRVDCIWGDYSQVIATLNMMQDIQKFNPNNVDRVILISGQDYPIKTNRYIKEYFLQHAETAFIDIEYKADKYSPLYKKIKTYKINKSNERGDYIMVSRFYWKNLIKNLIKGRVSIADLKYLLYKKEIPLNLTIYKGGTWWAFNYKLVDSILKFYYNNKKLLDEFYQTVFTADEMFFHTLIMFFKQTDTSIQIAPSLTYVNWQRPNVPLPVTFTKSDEQEIFSKGELKLFARKFDIDLDSEILNIMNKRLEQDES